jgi:hypothetical protein
MQLKFIVNMKLIMHSSPVAHCITLFSCTMDLILCESHCRLCMLKGRREVLIRAVNMGRLWVAGISDIRYI